MVDDDEVVPAYLSHCARKHGYGLQFVHARDVGEGIDRLNESCFDAAIIDVILPGVTGVSLAEQVRLHDPLIPLAYLTNLDTENVRNEAREHNATFLFKQTFIGAGAEGIERLLQIIRELAQLNPCLDGGVRIDNQGFERQLPRTPIELPPVLRILLDYSRACQAA